MAADGLLSLEGMSNAVSHSLPAAELFSALGSRSRRLSLSTWRRSPFAPHPKFPANEPLKTKKLLRSQALALPTPAFRVAACGGREFFKISTSRVLKAGETPRNQAFADRLPLPPAPREKNQISTSRLMQTLKMTDSQGLTRSPASRSPRSARP